LDKVTGTKTDLSEWSTQAATKVLVLRSEKFAEGTEDMDTGVNLLTVKVLGSSLNTFHEFVLVSRSEGTFFTVLLSLGNDSVSFAIWTGLVKEIDDFLVTKGSWGVIEDRGDSGGMDLGDNWVFFSGSVDDKVEGLLLDVKTNAHLTWDSDAEGTDSRDGVGTSESWEMVVDRGPSVDVELETHVVVP